MLSLLKGGASLFFAPCAPSHIFIILWKYRQQLRDYECGGYDSEKISAIIHNCILYVQHGRMWWWDIYATDVGGNNEIVSDSGNKPVVTEAPEEEVEVTPAPAEVTANLLQNLLQVLKKN